MRKVEDDPIARTIAENQLADLLAGASGEANRDRAVQVSRETLGAFKAVNLETAVSKVAGEQIPMRRLVITGPWEVDPDGKAQG